ncbi:MAG: choice-of-anchor B family protein [Bacteroidota bacterium]
MNTKRTFLFLVLSYFSWNLFAQANKNLDLVGRLVYPLDTTVSRSYILNDIWGYADSTGREYALVGTITGTSIVDLQDPTDPKEIHFVPGATSFWRDIKTYKNFAYVSNERGGGLAIIDLSGLPESIQYKDTIYIDSIPNTVIQIERDTLTSGEVVIDTLVSVDTLIRTTATAHNLYQDDGSLYIVGPYKRGGLIMLSLEDDPWNPRKVGRYTQNYVHDVYVRDGLAYTAEINAPQLSIVDVSDPKNPIILGSRSYPGAFTHNTWLNDSSTVCFTTDEREAAWIIAWDVRDPENIEELDRIRSSLSKGTAIPHNVHVHKDFLVTSYYKDGVQIVDANRPTNLVEIGYYDTHPDSMGGFSGTWGAYPFLPSGLILASDRSEGLFVLRPNYVRAAYFEGSVTDGISGIPLSNVAIYSPTLSEFQTQTQTDGGFSFGIPEQGTYQVIIEKFGYFPDTIEVELRPGEVSTAEIELTPMKRSLLAIQVVDAQTQELLEGTSLSLEAPGIDFRLSTRTNALGAFQDTLVGDIYSVFIGKWGFQTQRLSIDLLDETLDTLTVELRRGFYDDFAFDFGWEVNGPAKAGRWERAIPIGTSLLSAVLNAPNDSPEDLDEFAFVTGNSGITFFDADIDSLFTQLSSPIFDLGEYENPVILFSYWLTAIKGNNSLRPSLDSLEVFLHTPTDSLLVKKLGGPFNNAWDRELLLPSQFIDRSDSVWISFSIGDATGGDFVEAGIDFFEIVEGQGLTLDIRDVESNLPIGGAAIELINEDLDYTLTAQADTLGIYRETIVPGNYQLRVSKWGYKPQYIPLELSRPDSAATEVKLQRGIVDDFSLDLGWTVEGEPFQGVWERVSPRGTSLGSAILNPPSDAPSDLGNSAYVTDNSGISFSDADVDSIPTTLTSPPINVNAFTNPAIRFSYWLSAITADFTFESSLDSLQVFVHGSTDSLFIASFGGPFTNEWNRITIPLNTSSISDSLVQITFMIEDAGVEDLIEAGIDDFEVGEADVVSVDPSIGQNIRVFPNPVAQKLNIRHSLSYDIHWELLDALGRKVATGKIPKHEPNVSLDFPYSPGLYFLHLRHEDISLLWKKILK